MPSARLRAGRPGRLPIGSPFRPREAPILPQHPATVCVTGGAGFIGTWLVRRLLELGHDVVVLDDLSCGTRAPAPAERLRFVQGSVLDPAAVDEAARGADLLVHLAGVVGMRLATAERERAYRVAVEGTEVLLDRVPGVPAMLASSSAIYGLTDEAAVDEAHGGPEDRTLAYDGGVIGYATGKWRLEELGRAASRPILCVRPFNVVGPGQVSAYGMVIPSFVDRALAGEDVVVYDDGRQTRSFGHVATFVDAMVRAMQAPAAWDLPDRALNIGTSVSTSILQLARLVVARTASSSRITHVPYASVFPNRRDVRARVPHTRRLEALIGAVAWPGIEQVVDDVIAERRR